MGFGLETIALNSGFDDAYLVPGLFVENIASFGLYDLRQIMPQAKSVLLLIKKHRPYKPFPISSMSVNSHYPAYQQAYELHNKLIEKLNSMGIAAKSANMIPLKSYASYTGMATLKNSLMCHRDYGSYFVMQAVAVEAESESMAVSGEDVCGDCVKCIKACPMGAIGINGRIDAEKCIRNNVPVSEFIPEGMRTAAGKGYIGCGICQAVCPRNSAAKETAPPKELCAALDIGGMLDIGSDNGPLKKLQAIIGKNEARPGRAIATACMAAGNTRQKKYATQLETILLNYITPLARGYAAWALGRIGCREGVLRKALSEEHNADVRNEIISVLAGK